MEEDKVQLCLRLFAVIREYTIFAQKQHEKITNLDASIESKFKKHYLKHIFFNSHFFVGIFQVFFIAMRLF